VPRVLRRAVQLLLLPAVLFLAARPFLGNGDALLVAALAYAIAEARRRWRCFEACAPALRGRQAWRATPARMVRRPGLEFREPS